MTPNASDSVAAGIVFGLLTALIWGLSPVITRLGVTGSINPYDMAALRFVVAGLILLPLVILHGRSGLSWGVIAVMVVGAGAPFILLFSLGLELAPASHGGIITPSTMLMCSMLGGWFVLGDKPDLARLTGYVIVLAGIIIVGWEGLSGNAGPEAWLGDLMFMGAGGVWAVFTVASRKSNAVPLHATALVAVISMVLYLPAYWLWGEPHLMEAPWQDILLQAVFQGVFMAILALFFYTRAVRNLGAARGAVFAALVPGLTVLFAYPILGEAPSWLEILGVFVVSFGMVYALGLGRRADQGRR